MRNLKEKNGRKGHTNILIRIVKITNLLIQKYPKISTLKKNVQLILLNLKRKKKIHIILMETKTTHGSLMETKKTLL